ncbi:maleylpyruvate isomerase N-terminal domain-containing protein [Glaciihabitans sp. dw_435]|uniref:maleylpyruvate isomerase N-terminal domain-containing protein n=1 Tax=Glaciihabitans sp. dw_435 TaxID=2720081 RepID=UPI001BD568CE|nr:maleylpyruvate isomerase N-terminal domain-containing protein [Glaciihabitans sp. dw_435]
MTKSSSFELAASGLVALVERIPAEAWAKPGLGVWTVRDLVGHTSRAITTVNTYLSAIVVDPGAYAEALAHPPVVEEPTVTSAAAYYPAIFTAYTDNDAVAQRGFEAGAALGDDPAATIQRELDRTAMALRLHADNPVVTVGAVTIPLDEYLRTRTFELVVHSIDIARAAGVDASIPDSLLVEMTQLAAEVAVLRGAGPDLLLALTGRGPLPADFTIL